MKKLILLTLFSSSIFLQVSNTNAMGDSKTITRLSAACEIASGFGLTFKSLLDFMYKDMQIPVPPFNLIGALQAGQINFKAIGTSSLAISKFLTAAALIMKANSKKFDQATFNKFCKFLSTANAILAISNTLNHFITNKRFDKNGATVLPHLASSLLASYRLWELSQNKIDKQKDKKD